MLTIIACWIFLFLVIFLVGKLFLNSRLLSFFKIAGSFKWYEYFWSGLFIVFGILQIWSIFLPVNIYSLLFVVLLAVISLIIFLKKGFKLPKNINYNFVLMGVVGLFIISYYASQQPYMPDTLGYHLNTVKWINLFPVVPGLANLHSRLGFNTSFFPFASMLNNWFMRDRVSHLALSLLVAVLFIEFVWIFLKSKNRYLKLFCLFVVPTIVISVVKTEVIASLYYDFALVILILAACIEFIQGGTKSLIIAGLISFLIFTVKLSGVSFSFLILLFVIYKLIVANKGVRWRYSLGLLLSGLFVLIPYLVRNAFLSGWLLYPLPLFKMNFDWSVPVSQVHDVYTVTQVWARAPGVEWSKYIGSSFWDWFPSWFSRNSGSIEVKILFFTLALILLFPLIRSIKKIKFSIPRNLFYLCLTSLISILYILFTAPDIRFGGIFVWTFFAGVTSIYLSNLNWNNNLKILTLVISLIFIFALSWPIRIDSEPYLKTVRWDQASPTKNVNGILIPLDGSLGCGNSDLPCTPENNNIKWRAPGDLSKGFAPAN